MIDDLPPNVPSKVCLKCDGCCRFADARSPWRPKAAREEAGALGEGLDGDGVVKTVDGAGQSQCTFFRSDDNACRVYAQRPFECRLYPFLLTKRDDRTALGVHLSCPYVQEGYDSAVFEDLVEDLRKYFARADVRAFLNDNPSLAGEYPGFEQEIEHLFEL